jgi:hypothetical protein
MNLRNDENDENAGLGSLSVEGPHPFPVVLRLVRCPAFVTVSNVAWEERGGRRYYYRSVRRGGCVVKEYLGTGPVAEATAQLDEEDRRRREEAAEAWKEEMRRMEEVEVPIEALCDAAETLARAALVAAGYRQHNRGEWRLKRGDRQR